MSWAGLDKKLGVCRQPGGLPAGTSTLTGQLWDATVLLSLGSNAHPFFFNFLKANHKLPKVKAGASAGWERELCFSLLHGTYTEYEILHS